MTQYYAKMYIETYYIIGLYYLFYEKSVRIFGQSGILIIMVSKYYIVEFSTCE